MTKVEINSDGRAVSIEFAGDMNLVTDRALQLWRETQPPASAPRVTAAVGFTTSRAFQNARSDVMA